MIYLKTFKLSENRLKNRNIYPYNILKNKEPEIFVFDNITVLYGNNGCGKSTILNIIAHKLKLKGREKNNPETIGYFQYFENFLSECEIALGEDEYGRRELKIPVESRYFKSEEILYEIKKIQQDEVLKESYICNNIKKGMSIKQAKNMPNTELGKIQLERFRFAQDKYSNGETTMQFLDDYLEADNLYLLDEPEVSLSPQNQVELANKINEMARLLNNQFIIATHSPFMLSVLQAKIYNLDTKNYAIQHWSELENIKYFYNFFKEREKYFNLS